MENLLRVSLKMFSRI